MKCDIFIRSYWRDFPWLELCLQAIENFCDGFNEIIVCIPKSSEPWLKRYPGILTGVRLEIDNDYRDDYLGQQVCKLYADKLSSADLICHLDSDCMIRRAIQPFDLAPDGLPKIFTQPIQGLPKHWPWTKPTEDFLQISVSHDFMQYPPFTFPNWLYPKIREWSRQKKGVDLSNWVTSRPARGFSEFNVLAAYAYIHHRDKFLWVKAADLGEEEALCHWYWSWQGLDSTTQQQIINNLGISQVKNVSI